MNLLYVDLETGGIPVTTGIYEVGLIAKVNGQIVETLTIGLPINPSRFSEGMGQGYACISDEEAYVTQFKAFVAKYPYPFVAHNAEFDKGFLVHYGWVEPNAIFYDTLQRFRSIIPKSEIANYKLGTILEYYGVSVEGTLHTAIADLKGLVAAVNASGMFGATEEVQPKSVWVDIRNDVIEEIHGDFILKLVARETAAGEDSVIAIITAKFTQRGVNCMWSAVDSRIHKDDSALEKVKEGIKNIERHVQGYINATSMEMTMHYYHPIGEQSDEDAVTEANIVLKHTLKQFDFTVITQEINPDENGEIKTYLRIYGSKLVLEAIMDGMMYQIYHA